MRRIVRTLQSAAKSAMRPARMVVPIAAACMLMATGSQASGTDSKTFNVNIKLNSSCSIAFMSDINVTYESFGSSVGGASAQTTAAITCTNGLPYGIALDTNSGGQLIPGTGTYLYTDSVVALGYSLSMSGGGLNTLTRKNTGNGLTQNVIIEANLAGLQGGLCSAPGGICNNTGNGARQRTLTVTW